MALSGDDVLKRLEQLPAEGNHWTVLPRSGGQTSGTVTVQGRLDGARLIVPAAPDARTLKFSFSARPTLAIIVEFESAPPKFNSAGVNLVTETFGMTLGLDLQQILNQAFGSSILTAAADGSYTVDVPAKESVTIQVARTNRDEALLTQYKTSLPSVDVSDADQNKAIKVGDAVDGVIEPLEENDSYVVNLVAGQSVNIATASATGDTSFFVLGASELPGLNTFRDDGIDPKKGGLGPEKVFTAKKAGPYRIYVSHGSGEGGYRLTLTAA